MQNFSAMVRQAMSGANSTRAEGEKPEEDIEGDVPVTDDDESAEDDRPDEGAEDDQPEDPDAEGEEEEPTASASRNAHAAGRFAERARIAAIMGDPVADANPKLAAHLAFSTGMKASEARAALKASSPVGGKLAGKMAAAAQPRLGGSAPGGEPTPGDKLVALASTRFARGKAK